MTPDALSQQRQVWRKTLLGTRRAMPPEVRAAADARLHAALRNTLDTIASGVLAFYWPIQAEFDARPAVTAWLTQAGGSARRVVLPVVVAKDQPLRFRAWTPATPMQAAGFGTSVPSAGEWLIPTVLLIPLVGFDDAGYRLGYGGGYYDRTLASLQTKPRTIETNPRTIETNPRTIETKPHTIGIGYASGRLASIHPQAYDLKLDALITD